MRDTKSASRHAVDEFFRALSDRDVSIASAVLTEQTVEIIPLAMAGGTEPEHVFYGKDAVLGYLQTILDNFKQAIMVDRKTFITDDGATLFVEGRGDLIWKKPGSPIALSTFSSSASPMERLRKFANTRTRLSMRRPSA